MTFTFHLWHEIATIKYLSGCKIGLRCSFFAVKQISGKSGERNFYSKITSVILSIDQIILCTLKVLLITTNKRTASQHLKPFGFLQKSFYLTVNRFTLQSHYHVYNPQFQQAAVFSDQDHISASCMTCPAPAQ